MTSRRRAVAFLIVLLMLTLPVLSGCSYFSDEVGHPQRAQSQSLTVTAEGFRTEHTLRSGDTVQITAGPGVAAPGTQVTVRYVDSPSAVMPEAALHDYYTPVGAGVDISLAGGELQPQVPVQFTLSVAGDRVPADMAGDQLLAVSRSDDGDYTAETVQGRRVGDRYEATFSTTHFSSKGLYRVDAVKWMQSALSAVNGHLASTTKQPDCVGKAASIGGAEYRIGMPRKVADGQFHGGDLDVMYPCLSVNEAGDVVVTVQSSSPTSWEVRSEPRPESSSIGQFSMESRVVDTMAQALAGKAFLLPGDQLSLNYGAAVPQKVAARLHPGAMASLSLMFGLQQSLGFFGDRGNNAAALASAATNAASCATTEADAFRANESVPYIEAHFNCISGTLMDVLDDAAKKTLLLPLTIIVSSVNSGLKLAYGQISGAINELFSLGDGGGVNLVEMTVTRTGSAALRQFTSADGRVSCQIGGGMAGSWGGKSRPAPDIGCVTTSYSGSTVRISCETEYIPTRSGAASITKGSAPAQGVCTNGQPFNPPAPEGGFPPLESGATSSVDGFTCTGGTTITCVQDGTQRGFSLSDSSVTLRGGDSTDRVR